MRKPASQEGHNASGAAAASDACLWKQQFRLKWGTILFIKMKYDRGDLLGVRSPIGEVHRSGGA